jgi:hypothetical protein
MEKCKHIQISIFSSDSVFYISTARGKITNYLINSNSEGGVQLDPLDTWAINRPIMPNPGDYGDGEISGMMIGRVNRSTWRKHALVPLYPPQTTHALPGREPGPP